MNIAVIFDGAGLARLGLEQAGHTCTGVESDPIKHHLSKFVGSGNCILADATDFDLSDYDAVWASPPCQEMSVARTQGSPLSNYSDNLLDWCLYYLKNFDCYWVENVLIPGATWGMKYNAAQFTPFPLQNRSRMIGGMHPFPNIYRKYKKYYGGVCPAILATEWKGYSSDPRRASRYFGRRLTLEECSYYQGFTIPKEWHCPIFPYTVAQWNHILYEAIGSGIPPYMSRAFGEAESE